MLKEKRLALQREIEKMTGLTRRTSELDPINKSTIEIELPDDQSEEQKATDLEEKEEEN